MQTGICGSVHLQHPLHRHYTDPRMQENSLVAGLRCALAAAAAAAAASPGSWVEPGLNSAGPPCSARVPSAVPLRWAPPGEDGGLGGAKWPGAPVPGGGARPPVGGAPGMKVPGRGGPGMKAPPGGALPGSAGIEGRGQTSCEVGCPDHIPVPVQCESRCMHMLPSRHPPTPPAHLIQPGCRCWGGRAGKGWAPLRRWQWQSRAGTAARRAAALSLLWMA